MKYSQYIVDSEPNMLLLLMKPPGLARWQGAPNAKPEPLNLELSTS